MAQSIPANQKLYNMLIAQAKTRFRVYPSLAASHWVHDQYLKEGGQYVSSEKKVDPRFKDKAKDKADKAKEKQSKDKD